MERRIYASFDGEGIYVYQAFTPSIVRAALNAGTFAEGFGFDRMTWIKPSFGWILYRSGYGTKQNQEAILKIKLSHEGFSTILRRSVESSFDPRAYADEGTWKQALSISEVRHQWDPDRHIDGRKLERRAIQIGLRGATVRSYVDEWILALEEVTELAHHIQSAIANSHPLPEMPEERIYPVGAEIQHILGTSAG